MIDIHETNGDHRWWAVWAMRGKDTIVQNAMLRFETLPHIMDTVNILNKLVDRRDHRKRCVACPAIQHHPRRPRRYRIVWAGRSKATANADFRYHLIYEFPP